MKGPLSSLFPSNREKERRMSLISRFSASSVTSKPSMTSCAFFDIGFCIASCIR